METVIVAAIGLIGSIVAHWLGRRRHTADAAQVEATVAEAVQRTYQGILNDLRKQVADAAQEATSAREAARSAQSASREAEANAWKAESQARSMERFLRELRPALEHLPDGSQWLARLDRLVGVSPDHVNP